MYINPKPGELVTLSGSGFGLNTTSGQAESSQDDWIGSQTCPSSLTSPYTPYQTFTYNTDDIGTTFTYLLTCSKADGTGDIKSYVDVVPIPSSGVDCSSDPIPQSCLPTNKKPIFIER
jgi:hypothetical protein